MLKRHSRKLLPLALVLMVLSMTACPSANARREALKGAYRIQVVTDAAIDTTATLFHDGVLDKARTNQIAKILLKINDGNRVLIDKAAAMTADSPEARSTLIAQLQLIESAVKELKDAGVLGIKSKSGELAFNSAIAALDSSIAIIQAALAGRK